MTHVSGDVSASQDNQLHIVTVSFEHQFTAATNIFQRLNTRAREQRKRFLQNAPLG